MSKPCFALLWLSVACGALAADGDTASLDGDDDLLELFEFLGDEATASEMWNGFFDSLPEQPDAVAPPAAGPAGAAEARK